MKPSRYNIRSTLAVEDALPLFAAARLPRGRHMGITWYGGEPLLAKPAIERLSRAFLALCAVRGVRYDARIITNGYLLDETATRGRPTTRSISSAATARCCPSACHGVPDGYAKPEPSRVPAGSTTRMNTC